MKVFSRLILFQVWNEFKGFWNKEEKRWAYENYTEMYNLVYLRVKEVNPVAMIGGRYLIKLILLTNNIQG